MIGQRYAVGGSTAVTTARARRPSLRDRLSAAPSIAGRERLLQTLHESPLVQLMLAMSLGAVALLLYLAQAGQASVIQYNISYLQSEQTRLTTNNASLHATTASLQLPTRVEHIAVTQYHMVKPDLKGILWVRPIVRSLPVVAAVHADMNVAQQRSEPMAWMSNFIDTVKSSV